MISTMDPRKPTQWWWGIVLSCGTACAGDECPTAQSPALSVRVGNGAYQDVCAYRVQAALEGGPWFDLDCSVEGLDCICTGGSVPRTFEVALDGVDRNGLVTQLDQSRVEVEGDDCGPLTAQVEFERPPIEEFERPRCEEAAAHMRECGADYIIGPQECVDTRGVRPPNSEQLLCYYGCLADSPCEDIASTFCQPEPANVAVGLLIACYSACWGFDAEQTQEAAAIAAAWCSK